MSKHMYDAKNIAKQLYCNTNGEPTKKAFMVIALIEKATSDYEVDRILHDAREGKIRA